jgi:hypothetical protein
VSGVGSGRRFWRSALLSTLAGAAVSGLGTIPGMGLPGALALVPASPFILAIWGGPEEVLFPRDSAWPYAIMTTLALGPLVPAVWLGTRALGLSGWRRAAAVAAGMLAGATLVALAVYAWGVAPRRPTP